MSLFWELLVWFFQLNFYQHFHFFIVFKITFCFIFPKDAFFCPVYAEFGNSATDTISLTFTYGSTTSAKTNNILTRQIPCAVNYK